MKISINEDIVRKVVRESINKLVNEDRTEMNDGSVEIDFPTGKTITGAMLKSL